ncbi:MAG: hypothetical protein ACREWG_16190 [Gammaproteobacteria bacterium]
MNTALWAILSLLLPVFSTWLLFRRSPLRYDGLTALLAGVVIYIVLVLLPVQLLATLEMMHLIASVSLAQIALVELFVLVVILTYLARGPKVSLGMPESRNRVTTALAYVAALPTSVSRGGAVVGACYAVFLVNLLVSYPTGTDALSYHFPVALRWLQEGSLRIPGSKQWQFSLPGNAEVPMMILFGTGWQALATLPQMLGVAVLAAGSYRIAIRLGAAHGGAAAAVVILLSVPMITFQAFSGYIDLFGAAFLVAAVALFLSRYDGFDQPPPRRIFLARLGVCGLACGIALGTKPTYYVYAAAFWSAAVCVLGLERFRHRIPLKAVAAVMLVGLAIPSVFWFGRAVYATGNPLYPLQVEVMGHAIFDGYTQTQIGTVAGDSQFVRSRAEWIIYPWTEWKYSGSSYGTGTGLGAAFAAFVPLGLVMAIGGMALRKGNGRKPMLIFTAILFAMGVVWWFTLGRMLRFAIPLIAFSCVASAPLLDYLMKRRRTATGLLLVLSLGTTCLISSFQPVHSFMGRARIWNWTRAVYYGVPAIVDTFPNGSCVLNAAEYTASFALAGKRLSNRVITWFERPSVLTSEFLQQRGVDYVVKAGPKDDEDRLLSTIGARLIFDDASVLLGGGVKSPWRIWKIEDAPSPGTPSRARRCFE